jgi:adenylosuccinate lyase
MDGYVSPLSGRYSSPAMQRVFSERFKYSTWRRLWTELARAQSQLGFTVTSKQVGQLEANITNIDFASVAAHEARTHHEVMAHIHAYGEVCPDARPIIHLGATSAFVMDNGDLIQIREALTLLKHQTVAVMQALSKIARKYEDLPVLGYTHYQPAQLTTLGKRICLWLSDFVTDYKQMEYLLENEIRFLGMKGATGTQASILALAEGDVEKVEELDRRIADAFDFRNLIIVSGQTYPRKIDSLVYRTVAGLAESAAKMANDIRLMQHDCEVFEPFGKEQVGSSAMPYKRNPMKCERICALSRFLLTLCENGSQTASVQWLERSLDDSANKRLVMPQVFLTLDAILHLVYEVASGLVVNENVIQANVLRELPFIAVEDLMMLAVKNGGDRQTLHERLRLHALAAAEAIRIGKKYNDLFDRLRADEAFASIRGEIPTVLNAEDYVGLAKRQVGIYIQSVVNPLVAGIPERNPWGEEIRV